MKKIILQSATFFMFLFFSTQSFGQYIPGHLHGSTGNGGGMTITIDPGTGLGIPLAPHGAFGPVTEITFNPLGTILYGGTGFGSSCLITIDPTTGLETLIGMHQFGALNGLEFVGNTLYGTFFDGNTGLTDLVIVDVLTGLLTPVGPTGMTIIGGLAYDQASGILYGISGDHGPQGVPSELVMLDLNTGLAIPIGPVGVAMQCRGLTFGANDILYTGTTNSDPNPGLLLSLDPNTGLGTVIGPLGTPPVSGLAYPSPPPPIPVSNWAIILGVLLIGTFIVVRYRRTLA